MQESVKRGLSVCVLCPEMGASPHEFQGSHVECVSSQTCACVLVIPTGCLVR